MSRITYRAAEQEVTVVTGWDRPLQYAHLTVFDNEGEVVYDGLDSATAFQTTPDQVIRKLKELNIPYPEQLPWMLSSHKSRNAGNEVLDLGMI